MKAKMRNPFRLITKYPATGSIAVLIWVLCLVPIPDNPLGQVRLIDKWTHFVMYGGLCSVAGYFVIKRNGFLIFAFISDAKVD